MLTYTGILKFKDQAKQVSEKFRKRDFVITDNSPSYPQSVLFQLTQDRCILIDNVAEGEELTVHFSLRGREWKNPQGEVKYFNSLDVFKVESKKSESSQKNESEISDSLTPTPDDDLPF